jgi:membrane protease YdiL (CAAX protease family)
LVYIGLAIAGWFFALKRRGVGWREGGFRRVSGATLLKMIPVTLGLMFLNAIVVGLSAQVFGDVPTAQDQILGDATSITFDEFIWLFALGAIAAPIVEEFLFRGLLYPLLRGRMKVVVAVAVSALLFALLHFIPPLIPALLMMGIVLAILVERYNSIVPAIVVHALNNGAALIGLYLAIGR